MYVVLTLILLVQVVPDERQLNTTLELLHASTASGFLTLSPGRPSRRGRTSSGARRRSRRPRRRGAGRRPRPKLKGSIGEGPNHSNFSDRSSVRILGIQRKPRKAPSRKKPLQRSSIRPKIQEGAARMERKGKQTALRERGVRRSRTGAKDAILAIKRCYA